MNTRIIKTEYLNHGSDNNEIIQLDTGKQLLHPISNAWMSTVDMTNPICLTKFQLNKKEEKYFNNYKCKTGVDNYKKYMYVPPIGIPSSFILQIYHVESIDELSTWVSNNYEIKNYYTVNRILNCWIKNNLDTLKNYNNFLEKIYNKITPYYINETIKKKIKNEELELQKETKYFIDYWIGKQNINEFNFDLLGEYLNYLQKKYK